MCSYCRLQPIYEYYCDCFQFMKGDCRTVSITQYMEKVKLFGLYAKCKSVSVTLPSKILHTVFLEGIRSKFLSTLMQVPDQGEVPSVVRFGCRE
jgi:hypothetical protein